MKNSRDYGVELYRVLMMFGICMIHAVGLGGGKGSGWVSSALLSCVCGFVFISGYYGIRFKWIKLVKLYGLAAFAAALSTLAYHWVDPSACGNMSWRFAYTFRDYWFLNAYAVLMLMAPLLNVALEHSDRTDVRTALVLAVVCTIGWSFLAQLPYLRTYLPKSPGLHDYSGFMFMGIYIVAALWRKYVEPCKVSIFVGGVALLLLVVITSIHPLCLGAYSSPFSILVAAILFSICRRMSCPEWLGKLCVFLAPSLFSIYLLHTHAFGFGLIKSGKAWLTVQGVPYPVACLSAGVAVFVVCLAVDLCRRGLVGVFSRVDGEKKELK